MRGVCREARGGPACSARAGGWEVARRPGLWQLSRHFGQSPEPPSPWLHSTVPAGHPGLRPCPGTPRLAAGRWGGGQGPEGPSPQVTRLPWPSPPSQQGVEMGQPPGPHSAPAPMGTTAESGLIPDLVARIPCELWDPGGAWSRPGWVGGSAVHRGISGPSLCPPQGPDGHWWPSLSPPPSSLLPASSASSAATITEPAGGSPKTKRPWAWAVSGAPPPPTW